MRSRDNVWPDIWRTCGVGMYVVPSWRFPTCITNRWSNGCNWNITEFRSIRDNDHTYFWFCCLIRHCWLFFSIQTSVMEEAPLLSKILRICNLSFGNDALFSSCCKRRDSLPVGRLFILGRSAKLSVDQEQDTSNESTDSRD